MSIFINKISWNAVGGCEVPYEPSIYNYKYTLLNNDDHLHKFEDFNEK